MRDFAQTCEAVAATRSRLKKADLLQAYFARLSDNDLALAARYLSGRAFPLSDQRVLNVGYANIRDAVMILAPTTDDEFNRLQVQLGDLGDVVYHLMSRRDDATSPTSSSGPLLLSDVAMLFEQLAVGGGAKARVKLLQEALNRATALEARYLVKIMMGELRVGLQEGQVEDAIARAYGVTVEQVQWANMLLGDLGETAMLARHGRLADATMRLFHPLKFMLATPAENEADVLRQMPQGYYVEDKYDGVRAQVHKQGHRLAIFSRTLDEISHRFPELHDPLLALPGEFILDGEILGWRDGRAIPFTEFQPRLGRKTVDAGLIAALPVVFIPFDLLYQDSVILLEHPLSERRTRLEELLKTRRLKTEEIEGEPAPQSSVLNLQSSVLNPQSSVLSLQSFFDAARERGNEGLMVKDPTSTYKPGRRGREWLKVKRPVATLDVVVTGVEWGNGRRHTVLSDYTFAVRGDNGEFLEVGKAYRGLTDAEIAEMTDWFKAHTLHDYGRFRTVEPLIVLEVAFDNVQPSARHSSGYALRFPRIVRLRPDKPASEIDTLETVRRLAAP